MSKKFTATSAALVGIGRTANGGTAKFILGHTARLAKALDWPELPEGTSEWTPEISAYQATSIELIPNADALKKFAITLDTTKIVGLQVQRKAEKKGPNAKKAKKIKTEIVCTIAFSQEDGCAKLERYMQSGGPGSLTVNYVDAPIQDGLPGTGEEDGDGEE